jgi:hypothetical protein
LEKNGRNKVAQSLADPENYPNLFPELQAHNGISTEEEQTFLQQQAVDIDNIVAPSAEQTYDAPLAPEEPQEEDLLQLEDDEALVE